MKNVAVCNCLHIDLECFELVSEISRPGMKSIAENDNRRVKQTMLFFKRVAIYRNKLYP